MIHPNMKIESIPGKMLPTMKGCFYIDAFSVKITSTNISVETFPLMVMKISLYPKGECYNYIVHTAYQRTGLWIG